MSFKYEQIANEIRQDILSQTLSAGKALPSLRSLSSFHKISISTAAKAYQLLEQQGLIRAENKKGYFVCAITKNTSNKTNIKRAKLVRGDNSDTIFKVQQAALKSDYFPLGIGCIPSELLPIKELQRCLYRASRRHPDAAYMYGHEQGQLSLRQALASHLEKRQVMVNPDDILITNGCLESVNLSINHLTKINDCIAIFSPCFGGLLLGLKNSGRKVLEIPCFENGPDLDYLEQLMKDKKFQALIFSSTAYNPIGFNLSVEKKKRLAKLIQKYKIPSIEDDAFGELSFNKQASSPVYSYVSFSKKEKLKKNYITYCGSFSKPLASGYRIGWVINKSELTALVKQKMAYNLTVALPSQLALADYLFSEGYQAHIKRLKISLENQMLEFYQCVVKYFPDEIECVLPRGGFFLWIKLPDSMLAMDIYEKALDNNIHICPGDIFTMTGRYQNHIRLSLGLPFSSKIKNTIIELSKIINHN